MTLSVKTSGYGPDLALLHGWGLGASVWQEVAETLAKTCRVHLVSLPGYDGSVDDGAGFSETAGRLSSSLPAGTTLCGWSMGGMLTMTAATENPDYFPRLVLVGSTPSFVQRDGWSQAQPPSLLDGFTAAVATDTAKALSRFVMLFTQGDTAARRVVRSLTPLLDNALPTSAVLLRGLAWLRDTDLRGALPKLGQPTLIVHGECDPLMPIGAAEAMATALPRARIERLAGIAHAPFVSDPARFASLIDAFCHDSA